MSCDVLSRGLILTAGVLEGGEVGGKEVEAKRKTGGAERDMVVTA